jgi:hypothetical protein
MATTATGMVIRLAMGLDTNPTIRAVRRPPTRGRPGTTVANQTTMAAQAPTHLRTVARRINSNPAHPCRGTLCPTIQQIAREVLGGNNGGVTLVRSLR